MNCNECRKCNATGRMTELCLGKESRNLLLDLIEEAVKIQIDNMVSLYDYNIDDKQRDGIAYSVKTHFDCMLPDMSSEYEIRDVD